MNKAFVYFRENCSTVLPHYSKNFALDSWYEACVNLILFRNFLIYTLCHV